MASTSAAASCRSPPSAMKGSPNWLKMPDELMVNIFERLPTVEVLKSARKVCKTWGRICEYPEMWKAINMLKQPLDVMDWNRGLEALTKEAVDLSRGELIDISIEEFVTDDLLDYILPRSHKLKRLSLMNSWNVTGNGLRRAVKQIPQLEELHISYLAYISTEDIEFIGRNCPRLKSFRFTNGWTLLNCDRNALAIANNMPELRLLELISSEMTNEGLKAIVNGCPHLQSLDVRWCRNLDLDGDLGKVCMERIKDFKHGSTLHYEFSDDEEFFEEKMQEFFEENMHGDFYEDDYFNEEY